MRGELTVVTLIDEDLLEHVKRLHLGSGEKQVIHLGLAISPSWVLMDDLLAREEASHLGLGVKGTVGIIKAQPHLRLRPAATFGGRL